MRDADILSIADLIQLARHAAPANLHTQHMYHEVFLYLRRLWAAVTNLVPECAPVNSGETFVANSVVCVPFITVNGYRYGIAHDHRGKGYCHAYIEDRTPVRILKIWHVKIIRSNPQLAPLQHTFALVKPFATDINTPEMPWQSRYVDAHLKSYATTHYNTAHSI